MDLRETAREIGVFEVGINLSKVWSSADVLQVAGASMPLPYKDLAEKIHRIAEWLHGFGKKKYMFLTPEIALIEELGKISKQIDEVIISVPCDLGSDAKERLKNNLPHNISVSTLEEPFFPESFFPGNSMIVTSGYTAGGKLMVLSETYRLLEHYRNFLGKIVFIPYTELDKAVRYEGWMEIDRQSISVRWRSDT